jgi:hypothetical protein
MKFTKNLLYGLGAFDVLLDRFRLGRAFLFPELQHPAINPNAVLVRVLIEVSSKLLFQALLFNKISERPNGPKNRGAILFGVPNIDESHASLLSRSP